MTESEDLPGQFIRALEGLEERFREVFDAASDEAQLRDANAKLIGPRGELTQLMKLMPKLPTEQRRPSGQKANRVKDEIEKAFAARLKELHESAKAAELSSSHLDVTLPGRGKAPGRLHPIVRVRNELLDVFTSLGFDVADGPEIDLAEYNFDKLGFPPDHPATDMQDSFYIETASRDIQPSALQVADNGNLSPSISLHGAGRSAAKQVLRTHTSTIQVREMLRRKPPLAVVAPGAVYRRDDDITHSPMFFQIEGFMVDRGITFAHLKGILTRFAQRLFGPDTPIRLRPSYFPFVEPGGEVDIGCMICRPWQGPRTEPCRVCKSTGWLEVLGCGMIHPVVFENVGYDPNEYTGFAFGMGIDRITMLRYGISDIRLLFDNDARFLSQF